MKRLICLVLICALLMTTTPFAGLAEELPEEVFELEAVEALETEVEVEEEALVVEELGEQELTVFEAAEDSEDIIDEDSQALSDYAVAIEAAAVTDDAGALIATLAAGSRVLVLEANDNFCSVAFDTTVGVVTGKVPAASLRRLTLSEGEALEDELASSGTVHAYNDDPDKLLPTADCTFPQTEPTDMPDDDPDAEPEVITEEEPAAPAEAPEDRCLPAEVHFALTDNEIELFVNATYEISAITTPDGAPIDLCDLSFASNDPDIAVVDENGVVTALSAGEARIAVTYAPALPEGALFEAGEDVVTEPETLVFAASVTRAELNYTSFDLGKGETFTGLAATNVANVIWKSSNTSRLTVDAATGAVYGKSTGTAYACATDERGNVLAKCKIVVRKKPSKVTLASSYKLGLDEKTTRLTPKFSSGYACANLTLGCTDQSAIYWNVPERYRSYLTVDPYTGVLTPKKAGTAKVYARTYNGKVSNACTVYVRPAAASVKLDKTAFNLNIGATATLKATVSPSNAVTRGTFVSSDPSVATVSSSGKVKGISAGTAQIKAVAYNGIESAACTVTVWPAPTGVTLDTTSITLGAGMTYTLHPTVSEGANPDVSCSSDNSSYASCKKISNSEILVTAKKKGTANIKVKTSNGKYVKCKVVVKAAPSSIKLDKTALSMLTGSSCKLSYALNSTSVRTTVTFTSSDESVATVDNEGNVTSTGKTGTATVTAKTHNGKKATCKVTVKAVNQITVQNAAEVDPVQVGDKVTLVVVDEAGANVVKENLVDVCFASADSNIVSVDASGVLTAKAKGEALITVTTDTNATATVNVVVDDDATPSTNAIIESTISYATSKLGATYVYGTGYFNANATTFDCSGFTSWAYYMGSGKKIRLGTSAASQGKRKYKVNNVDVTADPIYGWKNCRRGDILCFKSDTNTAISHVGLYLGNGIFIHASSSGGKVKYGYFNSGSSAGYWTRNLVHAYHVV